jgi:hypothetical protein
MADTTNKLPEGTDTVIEGGGAGGSGGGLGTSGTGLQGGSPSTATNSTGARTSVTASDAQTDALITGGTASSSSESSSSGSSGGIRGMVSNVSTKARDEAANRARGFVGEGLKSGSTTLGNISTLIGDTVSQIEEKLGPQYAGYARTASDTIQRYATTLENKDPDELVDDARDLVRKSPGVALAGAAIIGFGLVRLLKAGMPDDEDAERRAARRRSGKSG